MGAPEENRATLEILCAVDLGHGGPAWEAGEGLGRALPCKECGEG